MRPRSLPSRALSRALGPLAVLAMAPIALSGCGGSSSSSSSSSAGNGIDAKTPTEILARAKAAVAAARSAHVSGALSSGGDRITLDLDLLAGRGGRGELSENGLSFELIDVGGYVYIKGSPAFYTHIAGAAAAQLFAGKWLKAPATSGNFASLASLTNLHSLVETALAGHGTLAKGATTIVDGQQAVPIEERTKGGALYVAERGPSYPIEIAKQGTSGGQIIFSSWNEPVSLAAPANAVDLSQLQGGA
jgi:hypothetical protein